MKVATILPQPYLQLTDNNDYHMCLAHLIEKPGMEKYTEFFKRQAAGGAYVIMDNGLIEGDPRPINELVEKAIRLGASELILPDVFRNSAETIKAVEAACDYIYSCNMPEVKTMRFMAVAQGSNIDEWVECAIALMQNPLVTCIGVPKVLVDIAGRDGRFLALQQLCNKNDDIWDTDIHLLGCWKTPLELTILAKGAEQGDIPPIRGVDSAIAYVYARANIKLNDDDRPDSNPIDFEKGDVPNKLCLAQNILLWLDSVDVRKDKNIWYL